jgi:hypothetical protein
MTLTYPILNRARRVLWLVTGSEKAGALVRLRHGDLSIPAARVERRAAFVLADTKAAAQLDSFLPLHSGHPERSTCSCAVEGSCREVGEA